MYAIVFADKIKSYEEEIQALQNTALQTDGTVLSKCCFI